ncbi:MAG TPA: GNAT family N-acetyltransferase [Gaiellaceae bacterium]|nr:GNAT family N-acetyltransferase [Gaiellaceae bacterium]
MDVRVEHEPGRFFARVGDLEGEIVYERRGDVLDVQHTWTPPALRGNDVAARLTDAAFAYAREHGLRIVPTCSYTRAWVARHPEVASLVAPA